MQKIENTLKLIDKILREHTNDSEKIDERLEEIGYDYKRNGSEAVAVIYTDTGETINIQFIGRGEPGLYAFRNKVYSVEGDEVKQVRE